jgi:hypothetical protein
VFTEVTFWNSAEYGILRDFTSAEFRAIPCTEYRIRNLSNKFMQETLIFSVLRTEVEFKNQNFAFIYLNDPFRNILYLKKL